MRRRYAGLAGASLAIVVLTATAGACMADPVPVSDHAVPARHADHAAARESVHLSAVGDTILGNTPSLPAHPRSYLSPIAAAVRDGAQVVFANLEGTLTDRGESKCSGSGSGCFAFRNPPSYGRVLADTGFTILNNANNHSHDFGTAGLDQTIRSIHRAGMEQTGLPGQITVVRADGIRIAILGFAPYSNTADLLDLPAARRLVHKAARRADDVVVYMHAGAEGTDAQHVTGHEEHYLGEDRGNPERFAHLAIRAGADLVIASGPHVLRGMQFYRGRLIAYSLGNFANYHNFGGGGVLSDSGILRVSLAKSGRFVSARLISVHLDGTGRAHLGGDSVTVVRRLSKQDFGHTAVRLSRNGRIRPR